MEQKFDNLEIVYNFIVGYSDIFKLQMVLYFKCEVRLGEKFVGQRYLYLI